MVFLVSVPFGVFGTVWAYLKLRELGVRRPAALDWWGNLTFAAGLIAVLVGITYGIQPYGGHTMGWTNPLVIGADRRRRGRARGFLRDRDPGAEPMFQLDLFRIRAFTAGNLASLLAGLGRGGLMFILIIWLQGIWLPRHGYSFESTPLWAGIFMLPLTVGFLIAGPASGWLSDRFGARPFATGGMLVAALSFVLLELLPVNFDLLEVRADPAANGIGMGLFASPNRAAIMNSLPPDRRGVGAGMSATFQNTSMVLSIGIFFSLMILGLAGSLPATLNHGLAAHGVPAADAPGWPPCRRCRCCSPRCSATTRCSRCSARPWPSCPPAHASYLTGHTFFPSLISAPFHDGLVVAFAFAIAACLIAAVASWLIGGKYVHEEQEAVAASAEVESGDDLEGSQAGVLGVGDAAPVGGHLAQRG